MDWKKLGKEIAKIGAPLLGTALGGPGGTAIGSIIASLFGVDNESEAIYQAIQTDPQAATKLRELEFKHKERLEELQVDRARIENERELGIVLEINKTMREEGKSEHWPQWGWRPYWGFISGTAFLVVCIFVGILGYKAIASSDTGAIGSIPLIIGAYTSLFAIPGAILGITAWGRNKLKEKAAEVQAPI